MTKILIVDDARFIRLTLAEIFTKQSFTVTGMAKNGAEGVELYKETAPDIVTMDVTMPVMNGINALEKIIAYDPKANVIMCSAMSQKKLVVEAIELGAKDFIIKPFNEVKVLEVVTRFIPNNA